MKLGKKILELRKKSGLSQEGLGEKIDVTRQTISNWELGITSPNPEQLKMLSKEFNISIDELLDNDIHNIIVQKVSNTEELAGLILKFIKVISLIIGVFIIGFICLLLFNIIFKTIKHSKENGNLIEESIICELYGEEHSFDIKYYELTGKPLELGGDPYFSDILDLGRYNDAHQIFNVINDYVKKNGGTCHMVESRDLNDIVNMYIKEGSLNKKEATVIIEELEDYDITYGEEFWIEKYENNDYIKLDYNTDNHCAFNMIAYSVTKDNPLELVQNWSCMYGSLDKGIYRIVKRVFFNSDKSDYYYIWAEFEIE